ncbi:hypothetical protein D9613_006346 [Agrocybe pediades]|uniref:Nephrocystin 3-like N-terminal domain-containing protein n=1 Tax=Agrocybe pediades TaxID=84607 RepID=A0A8H4QV89_9AGAR|nr:hypothetical protein D9613_006346 [Agrocybe pediades]
MGLNLEGQAKHGIKLSARGIWSAHILLPRSAMISSSQGVFVNGGQFIQNNYHGHTLPANKAPIDILTEAVAPRAFHDSGASFDKPKCHPRTRVKILEEIMRWILGECLGLRATKQFMWLNGAAGCGKSAIAQTTVESCIQRGLSLASFFFNRSDPTRNHAGPLVATLAYQLYRAFRGTGVQKDILSAIQEDPFIFKKTLQQQFTSLIIQPLTTHFSKDQSSRYRVPFLIVIDGLDECTDRTSQKEILTGLADCLHNSNLFIPIFVASRPEHDIKLSFASKYLKAMHISLSLDLQDGRDADSDIRLYLLDRFAEIKDDFDNRTAGRKLVQDWPSDRVIETLVKKSSQQFIYAATVVRYVESTRHRPDHRLEVVLNLRPVNGDHPFAELDSLYAMVLESTLDIKRVREVLSLCLMNYKPPICCSVIEKMLSYDEGEVETLFCDMGALVRFEPDKHYIMEGPAPLFLRILHASLEDYLLDAARSKQLHIDEKQERIKHVTHSLQYLALCSSSSFNPNSPAGAPIYILHTLSQKRTSLPNWRMDQITNLFELRQPMLSFPLKEFLEPHPGTRTYPLLVRSFLDPFIELLKIMVHSDPTLSYVQDHQLRNLEFFVMQQIPQYFKSGRLALILVLFYHVGSNRLVPILECPHDLFASYRYRYSTPFDAAHDFDEGDILSLSCIWEDSTFLIGDDKYYHYVRKLLHNPDPIATYAIGSVMHERAALACFQELAKTILRLPSSSEQNIAIATGSDSTENVSSSSEQDITIATGSDGTEDDANPKLMFKFANGGPWRFECSSESKLEPEELYFVLLGYLIFLLPRCGRSDALVAACEEHDRMSYIDQQNGPLPVRRRLLRVEIDYYMSRTSLQLGNPPLQNRAGCCFVM